MIQLVNASGQELALIARRPPRPPLLVAPLLAASGLLPWLAPGPLTLARALTAVVLLVSAALLTAWGLPRRRRLSVQLPRDAEQQLELGAYRRSGLFGDEVGYRARLRSTQGNIDFERRDPGELLVDIAAVAKHLPFTVTVDPSSFPINPFSDDDFERLSMSEGAAQTLPQRHLVHARPFYAALGGAIFVTTFFSALLLARARSAEPLSELSVLLGLGLIALLLLVAAALGTDTLEVTVNGRVRVSRRILGRTVRHLDIPADELRGAIAVGQPNELPSHILLCMKNGKALAFPSPRSKAFEVVRLLNRKAARLTPVQ